MGAEGYCWSRTSERQVLRIRYLYLQAILRQEVGFFDSQEATTSEIINSISKDASLVQEVLSEKVYDAHCHFTRQNPVKKTLQKFSKKNFRRQKH